MILDNHLLLMLIRQHIRAHSPSNHTTDGTKRPSAELGAHERSTGAAHERRPKSALTFRSRCARLAVLPLLVALLRRAVALVAVALVRRRRTVATLVLLRWVGRLSAVRVVALVVVAIAALVLGWRLLVGRRCAVGTLRAC
jgi:hypothetical protein